MALRVQAPLTRGKLQHYNLFLGHPWGAVVKGKPSQCTELQAMHLVTLFFWKKNVTVHLMIGGSPWAGWLGRNLKGMWLDNWWKEVCGRPLCMGEGCKDICGHMNAHQTDFSRRGLHQSGTQNDLHCELQSASLLSHPCHCPVHSRAEEPWWQGRRLCMGSAAWTHTQQTWPGHAHAECQCAPYGTSPRLIA